MGMNVGKRGVAAALAGAALAVGMAAAPASAEVSATLICDTTGARGVVVVNDWQNGGTSFPVSIAVGDNLADGHHVRVRVVGRAEDGDWIYWPWHANYDGNGTAKSWSSTANFSGGIYDMGVQAARFEGDTLLNYCTDWMKET
ncbi:hypothetical protein OG866_32705 [Streptomyces sp. NBC_00663]|uniref:hypothetical protein n=1 Tax=Streptomyces sp. NBC_00663 TaxID=2975801 RepID=UPI002E35ABCD|nr:hypothetical protein [Streptomyces sp. NBC_00663]